MEGFKEGNECSCFRRAEIFAVGRHVAAALDHLTNDLVMSEAHGDAVECRPALTSFVIE